MTSHIQLDKRSTAWQ